MNHSGLTSTALWLMALLGAYHGINPGMGWLFAVALGMQEQKGSAVARSLVPIALGHALAIGVVVLAAAFLGMALPREAIRYPVAALLAGLGVFSLVGHYHPRWVRMKVGFRDLTVWSFLMASAHGAGLMVVPVLLGSSTVEAADRIAGHHHMSGRHSWRGATRNRHSYSGLSCGNRAHCLGGLYQGRSCGPSQGMAQSRFRLGNCARGDRPCHPRDVAGCVLPKPGRTSCSVRPGGLE